MPSLNKKNMKVLNRLAENDRWTEKEIAAMNMDDMLAIPNITVSELEAISALQKAIRSNSVLSFIFEGEKQDEA